MKRAQQKLTKTIAVEAVAGTNDYVLWDSEVVGFGLRVWPTGKKTFIYKFRSHTNRQRKMTIGAFPAVSVDQARRRARELAADIMKGVDPQQKKDTERRYLSVADLGKRYLSEYAELHKKHSSAMRDENLMRMHILPFLGSMKVAEVTNDDVYRLHHRVSVGGVKIHQSKRKNYNGKVTKPQPITANRVIALLSTMMNLAEQWGLRPQNSNPCKHIKRNKENKRERYLVPNELAAVSDAMQRMVSEGRLDETIEKAIKLLMFTGCRVSEVLNLRWDEVDFEHSRLNLKVSKTGAKSIPIGAPALQIIASIAPTPGNDFVFVGRKEGAALAFIRRAWRRICAEAKLEGVRLHDLRHTYASFGVSANMSLPVIGKLLGHTQAATTQRYAHLMDDPLRTAADQIASSLEVALNGTPANRDQIVNYPPRQS